MAHDLKPILLIDDKREGLNRGEVFTQDLSIEFQMLVDFHIDVNQLIKKQMQENRKNIIIPKGTIINNARIDWNGIEFEATKENQYDYGTRNANFGDFEILSIVDRSKEADIPPFNQLKKNINGFPVMYRTIVNAKLNKTQFNYENLDSKYSNANIDVLYNNLYIIYAINTRIPQLMSSNFHKNLSFPKIKDALIALRNDLQ
jgi:hypothetical protein